jgi:dimeric dUTPase (all-alpha-NTP-PPase superfamily)
MKKTEVNIELNVHELDIILKALELVESIDEIQINRSSGSIDTLYDRLYDYYAILDTTNVELNYESYVDQSF